MLGIVVAMQKEANALIKIAKAKERYNKYQKEIFKGEYCGIDFVLCVAGVGKVNCGIGCQYIIDNFEIDKILNFGIAGGVSDRMEVGETYEITKAVQYDFDLAKVNNTTIGTLNEYTSPFLHCSTLRQSNYKKAVLGSGDRFNDDKRDFRLLTKLKVDIRDMEGASILQTSIKADIPTYIFKTISDISSQNDTIRQYNNNALNVLDNLQSNLKTIFNGLYN